jgi:hypothetical protein
LHDVSFDIRQVARRNSCEERMGVHLLPNVKVSGDQGIWSAEGADALGRPSRPPC